MDAAGAATERAVWPLALSCYSHVALLGAWRGPRAGFRFPRTDRIEGREPTGERLDARSGAMLEEVTIRHEAPS